jgi:hypothetical protein
MAVPSLTAMQAAIFNADKILKHIWFGLAVYSGYRGRLSALSHFNLRQSCPKHSKCRALRVQAEALVIY